MTSEDIRILLVLFSLVGICYLLKRISLWEKIIVLIASHRKSLFNNTLERSKWDKMPQWINYCYIKLWFVSSERKKMVYGISCTEWFPIAWFMMCFFSLDFTPVPPLRKTAFTIKFWLGVSLHPNFSGQTITSIHLYIYWGNQLWYLF